MVVACPGRHRPAYGLLGPETEPDPVDEPGHCRISGADRVDCLDCGRDCLPGPVGGREQDPVRSHRGEHDLDPGLERYAARLDHLVHSLEFAADQSAEARGRSA